MKRLLGLALTSSIALTVAAPASAGIFIGGGMAGGTVETLADDSLTPGSANYFFAIPELGTINIVGTGRAGSTNLFTNSLTIIYNGGLLPKSGATFDFYITKTNIESYKGGLLSSFNSNLLTGNVSGLTISSYYSANNARFGGTLLQSKDFTGNSVFEKANNVAINGPYSETLRYSIKFNGAGSFNGTANILATQATGAVPEPASWAMMIVGFALIGGALRRRKASAAGTTAAFA